MIFIRFAVPYNVYTIATERMPKMKVGMRKPSVKKSIKARTTGKAKRAVKKAVIPGYGKKGSGWIKDPKKAAYNKVYNKTTFGVNDIHKGLSSSDSHNVSHTHAHANEQIVSVVSVDPELEKILTPQEKKKHSSLIQIGFVLDQDREAIIKPNGKPEKIKLYSVCSILSLVFAIPLLLFGLIGFSYSLAFGMIFIIFSLPFFLMARSYKTTVSLHKKIFELKDKGYLSDH